MESKLLFLITLFFSLWVLDIFVLWTAAYNDAIFFGWQITQILEIPLFLFSVYFAYVITNKNRADITNRIKTIFLAIILAAFVILPTSLNIFAYDLAICEGLLGLSWDLMYIFEFIAIFWIAGICIYRYRHLPKNDTMRSQIAYFGAGILLFLILFNSSNLVGQITGIQEISFVGSLGMVIFLSFLAYMIVRFRTFNIRLIATQALSIAIAILIASQFFYPQSTLDYIITAISLFVFIIGSYFLVLSVKREIKQREQIEKLAMDLKEANQGQANLMHIMNHQIKGRLGTSKNIFAELMTNDYGVIPESAKFLLQKGLDETNEGVNYVQSILKGMSAETGKLPYNMTSINIKDIVSEITAKQKEVVSKKGLSLDVDIKEGNYTFNGDALQIKEALNNMIDNSINYTQSGGIKVSLEQLKYKIVFAVKDTGVGLSQEDKTKLFKAGGRGVNSIKININSTGYGLAFVKGVVEAHGGRVWAESEGTGKGSQFYIELPYKQTNGIR